MFVEGCGPDAGCYLEMVAGIDGVDTKALEIDTVDQAVLKQAHIAIRSCHILMLLRSHVVHGVILLRVYLVIPQKRRLM